MKSAESYFRLRRITMNSSNYLHLYDLETALELYASGMDIVLADGAILEIKKAQMSDNRTNEPQNH